MGALETIRLIATLFAAVREVVLVIEQAMPESGRGAAKLAAAKELLTIAGAVTEASAPFVDKVIAAAVALYNASGTFRKVSQ